MREKKDTMVRGLLEKAMMARTHEELVSYLLQVLALLERDIYLEMNTEDKGNGFRNRRLHAGSLTYELYIPRTRKGNFRPSFLPDKWKRTVADDFINLAYSLILSSKSIESAKRAIRELNLPLSEEYFDRILEELRKEFKALNNAPLLQDWFSLVLDAKHTQIMIDGLIKPYVIYTVVGTSLEWERKILLSLIKEGNENIDMWKKVLGNLISRGLRRVLIITHDDYPGLSKTIESYFTSTDVQLCLVHLIRNLKRHLTPSMFTKAKEYLHSIKNAVSYEHGFSLFEEMLKIISEENPDYAKEIERKKKFYLPFLKYPKELRKSLYSTNLLEGINRKIEDAEKMSGGYFHSLKHLEIKLSLVFKELHTGRWSKTIPLVAKVKHFLYAVFQERFYND